MPGTAVEVGTQNNLGELADPNQGNGAMETVSHGGQGLILLPQNIRKLTEFLTRRLKTKVQQADGSVKYVYKGGSQLRDKLSGVGQRGRGFGGRMGNRAVNKLGLGVLRRDARGRGITRRAGAGVTKWAGRGIAKGALHLLPHGRAYNAVSGLLKKLSR